MADTLSGITPVAANVQPLDAFGTLNNILGIQSKRQQLQSQALELQQSQGLQKFFTNFNPLDYSGDNGMVDMDKVHSSDLYKNISGNARPLVDEQLLKITNGQLKNQSDLMNLGAKGLAVAGSAVGSIATHPDVIAGNENGRTLVKQTINNLGAQFGPGAKKMTDGLLAHVDQIPADKLAQDLPRSIQQFQKQVMDTQQQLELTKPGGMTVTGPGGVERVINANPYAAQPVGTQVGKDIARGVPPGAEIVEDAYRRKYTYDPATRTITPLDQAPQAPPRAGAGAAPPSSTAPRFTQPVPGQEDIEKAVGTTRRNDADYGTNKHINASILNLSKDTKTGPGTAAWHNALGSVAGLAGGDQVADYQTISALLDRQSAMAARQMSLPDTNAGLETARGLSGTTAYEPGALQTKVKLADALVEGAHAYRQGLDKFVGTGPNQDLSKFNAYNAAWADNFDPRHYLNENSKRRGNGDDDKKERAAIANSMSPQEAADFHRKRQNLELLRRGILPPQQ